MHDEMGVWKRLPFSRQHCVCYEMWWLVDNRTQAVAHGSSCSLGRHFVETRTSVSWGLQTYHLKRIGWSCSPCSCSHRSSREARCYLVPLEPAANIQPHLSSQVGSWSVLPIRILQSCLYPETSDTDRSNGGECGIVSKMLVAPTLVTFFFWSVNGGERIPTWFSLIMWLLKPDSTNTCFQA